MKIRWIYFIAGTALSVCFILFTFIVRSDALRQFDFNTTVRIQDKLPEKAYEYLHLISIPAGFEIITTVMVIILAITRKWIRLIISVSIYGAAHVFELIGKLILSQSPPQFMFYKLQSGAWFPDNYQPEGNSYPSGHSFRAFFFAVLMTMLILDILNRRSIFLKISPSIILLGFAAAVALAKVSLGQHWATDVISGFLLGTGSALVAAAVDITARGRLNSRNKSDK